MYLTKEELEYILMCIDFTQSHKGCNNQEADLREKISNENTERKLNV